MLLTAERAEARWGPLCLSSRLALRVLHLAQRQYSLLQAANLLTPDMIAEFETLQQLLQEENAEPGGESSLLLLICNCLCRTFSGSCIGLGSLTSYGQTFSVSDSAVAS